MKKVVIVGSTLVLLSACSTFERFTDTTTAVDYSNSGSIKALDFPPDLTAPEFDDAFAMPSAGSVRASAIQNQGSTSYRGRNIEVLPASTNMRIGISGNVRWLDIGAPANVLWPKMKDFWRSIGVGLKRDEPRIGIMETEWLEKRAGLPMDWVRKTFGKLFQGSFDSGTRDRFRIRVERPSANTTRIFLTHKGAEQIVTDSGVGWELRPPKRELEAEMLNRLQAFLQGDKYSATRNVAESDASQTSSLVSLMTEDGNPVLQVNEPYSKAWVRTAIMLERMGLNVESRNQAQGIYGVEYNGDDELASSGGFFSRIFKGRRTLLTKGTAYQIHIRDAGRFAAVRVMDEEGVPLPADKAQKVLSRLKLEFDR